MGPNDTLRRLATELVQGCREGREAANLDVLYAPDAVSVEAYDNHDTGAGRESIGIDAIKAKHDWWNANFEPVDQGLSPDDMVRGPYYAGDNAFAVFFVLSVKHKQSGEVQQGTEIAVYHVSDGRIVREEFFYPM